MAAYQHIFFDLDHTLWDFEKNCAETLTELYVNFQMAPLGFTAFDLIEKYKMINERMWYDYNRGKIGKEAIRATRFRLTFEELGVDSRLVPEGINEEFLRLCPAKGNVMPFAHETLQYLAKNYQLHIITNGFKETQHIKISTSNLAGYFSEVILAEHCGYSKPDRKIFDYALEKVKSTSTDCIMIGDDLFTDVLGAKNAGLDHVYYNPKQEKHSDEVTYEIKCLSELTTIL
jgi:putative hydrolase of the HAD superfamily